MKQTMIVNDSLKLARGKLAAQVAHASVASFLTASPASQKQWLAQGMPKIVLSGTCEQELIDCYQRALTANLPAQIIKDAGKTIVAEGTMTCVGLGPAPAEEIDKITGHLPLVS